MLIRQQAFEGGHPMLKGGLHCHTTRSDGQGTPEEVIRLHAKNGYDFLAITDHRTYNFKNFAPDVPITIIPGMEYDAELKDGHAIRNFHTVCIGPADSTNGFHQDETFEFGGLLSSQEEYQLQLDMLHKNNNLTVYCHPEWSSTPARCFERLQGNFAMEIWNSGCAIDNGMDMNAAYWDEILGQGKRIFGVATDDGHLMTQHCNGWVMVNAENNVPDILKALREGRFYSSCGPVIKDFYVEDGIAHVKADPCSSIQFLTDCHPTRMFRAEEGASLTDIAFDLEDDYFYVRACVIDSEGRRAWTNPIFLKDF